MNSAVKIIVALSTRSSSIILGYAIMFWLNRHYDVGVYGLYSYYLAFVFTYSMLLKLGFDVLIMREKDESVIINDLIPSYLLLVPITVLFSLIVYLATSWEWELLVASHLFATTLVLAELSRRKGGYMVFILFSNVFFLLLQLVLFLVIDSRYMKLCMIISYALPLLALMIYIQVRQGVKIPFRFRVPLRSEMKNATYATLLGMSSALNNQASVFILSFMVDKEMLGIFSIARRISTGASLPVQILNVYNAPTLVKLRTGTKQFQNFIDQQMLRFFQFGFLLPLLLIPSIVFVPMFLDIPNHLRLDFYVITIIFLVAAALNGITGPTFPLIRIVSELKNATKVQLLTYLIAGMFLIGIAGLQKFEIINTNISILTAVIISIALTFLNLYYAWYLKTNNGITLIGRIPHVLKKRWEEITSTRH